MTPPSSARVVWTAKETETVIAEAVTLLVQSQAEKGDMTPFQAILRAQKRLPLERRRQSFTRPSKCAALIVEIEKRLPASEPAPIAEKDTHTVSAKHDLGNTKMASEQAAARPRSRYGYRPSVSSLLEIIADHPGITPTKIAELTGWDITQVSGSLVSLARTKRGGPRLIRIEIRSDNGRKTYRYYRPEDLPADVLQSMNAAIEGARQIRLAREAEAEVVPEAEAEVAPVAVVPEPAPIDEPHAPAPVEAAPAGAGALPALLHDLAQRIAGQLVHELEAALLDQVRRLVESLPVAPPPTAPSLAAMTSEVVARAKQPPGPRRVLIVGLLPAQAGMIANEYGARLDLRFVQASESLQKLKGQVESVDEAVQLCDFVSHSHQDLMRNAKKWHRLHGGMTRLREYLNGLTGTATAT